MQESIIELQPKHRKKLKLHVSWALAFPFLVCGMFYFILRWVGAAQFLQTIPFVFKCFLGLMALAVIGIVLYIAQNALRDLRKGEAIIIRGVVSDKKKEVTTKTTTNNAGRSNSTSTSSSTSYFLYIGEMKYKINPSSYAAVRTGDEVALTLAPKSKLQLDFEVLQRASENSTEPIYTKQPVERVTNTSITSDDVSILKKWLWMRIKRRLIILSVPLFVQCTLILNDYWGISLVFFPLYLVILWQTMGALRSYLVYKKVVFENTKKLCDTTITDKSHTTYNGKSVYRLSTTLGKIKVNKSAYEVLTVNKHIVLHYFEGIQMPLVLSFDGKLFSIV